MMKRIALFMIIFFLFLSIISCSQGKMEVLPMKIEIKISRDISWAKDPTIIIGAESAYLTDKELVIEGPFSFGAARDSQQSAWITTAFIRNGKLIILITDRMRVKIVR